MTSVNALTAVSRTVRPGSPTNIGAMLSYSANGWRTAARATAYAPPTITQLATNHATRRRSSRASPSSQPHTISAGATAAFSFESRPSASAAALQATLSCTKAAYTATSVNSAPISSARPTTLATASTWTGCTANSSPATSAPVQSDQRRASAATATEAAACHARLTA